MPIDGLVSGLDTNALIEQLMNAERVPVDLMTARKNAAQGAVDAFKSIQSKFTVITAASAALERSTGWKLRTGTSSNPALATVTAAEGATLGGIQFTVDRLATTHGLATAANTAATTDVIASSGSVQLTVGSTVHNLSVGSGSLAEVATAINAAGIGVKAATVNTGTGYRLQLTAGASGQAAAFSVTGGLDVATVVTNQGVDAKLTFGTGPGAYAISSSTNTFANVLPGVSITAKSPSAEVVTVDVGNDSKGLADKIQNLVDAVNGALTEIKTRTAYDPASRKAASLAGDSATRQATQALTRALSDAVSQSSLGAPGLVGVSIDRNGKATFDRDKFTAAFDANPAAVERMFVQGATTTGSVSFVSAGSRAVAGARNVVVTQAATQASHVGMVGAFPLTVPATIRIKMGATEIVYPASSGATEADTRTGLQTAIDNAGLAMSVTSSGGGLKIGANNYGSAAGFQVDWGSGSYTAAAGLDAAGTIDGVTATGTGRQLSIPATDGLLSGLSVALTSDATGAVGTVNYEPGLAQRISSAIVAATDSTSGYLTNSQTGRQARVDLLSTSISSYEIRLTAREKRLRAEYAKLEVTLNSLKQQSSNLSAQTNASSSA